MYFTIEELTRSATAKKKGIDNTPSPQIVKNLEKLIEMLDVIREAWGSPILVTSGYRCPELNKAVKGSKTSQHMYGQAADIKPKYGKTRDLFNLIVELMESGTITVGQLIDEYGYKWIHVSTPNRKKNQILHIR